MANETSQGQAANQGQAAPTPRVFGQGREVDWGEAGRGSSDGGGGRRNAEYVKMQEGQAVKMRFAGNPYEFSKHWQPIEAISPGQDLDVCWKEGGHRPSRRFSAWVIDRADGHMKVFDFGPKVFAAIKNWAELKKKSPGGPEGTDWLVSFRVPKVKDEKTGQMVPNRRQTEWQVMHDDPTPFTDAEKKMIEEIVSKNPLNEIRKATAPERIKEMWEEAKKNPSGPIPGSRAWWQARQAARSGQGGVRYDQPAPAAGAAVPAAAVPAAGAAAPAAAPAAAGGAPADETSSGHLFDSAPEDGEGSSGLF